MGFVELGLGDTLVPKAGGCHCCWCSDWLLWRCCWNPGKAPGLPALCSLCPRSVMWLAPHPPAAA